MGSRMLQLTAAMIGALIFLAASTTLSAATEGQEPGEVEVGGSEGPTAKEEPYSGDLPSRRVRRFLASSFKLQTCEKNLEVCKLKGSPGPDCCNKCVDRKTDSQNCGQCGWTCSFSEQCCDGTCVDVAFDWSNCGGCGNQCSKGSCCKYGMCGYA